MTIEIRPCTTEDGAAVSKLLGQLGYRVSAEAAGARVRRLGQGGSDPVFLACEDGDALGLIAVHIARMVQYERPAARITALVVDHRHRRRGIGRLLIAHAGRAAAAAGCEIIELTSAMDRAAAHAFYRSLGYEANSLRFRKLLGG